MFMRSPGEGRSESRSPISRFKRCSRGAYGECVCVLVSGANAWRSIARAPGATRERATRRALSLRTKHWPTRRTTSVWLSVRALTHRRSAVQHLGANHHIERLVRLQSRLRALRLFRPLQQLALGAGARRALPKENTKLLSHFLRVTLVNSPHESHCDFHTQFEIR